MEKVLAFLEKHVQWAALGLGGIYLLWMIWAYVFSAPVATQVGSTEGVTLRSVDRLTLDGPAQRLQRAMDAPPDLKMKVEKITDAFRPKIETVPDFPALAGAWTSSQVAPIPTTTPPSEEQPGRQPSDTTLAQVPQAPAPIYLDKSQGLSTIVLPAATRQQPGALPVPRGPDAQRDQEDRQWVTTGYTIPMAPLAADFEKANVPQELRTTYFLRVEAIREELNAAGQWVNPTTVQPLLNQSLPSIPDNWQGEMTYGDWASKNQVEILQPSFYQTVAADPWVPPGYQTEQDHRDAVPFDPANPPPRKLTPEEIEMVRQYRIQEGERSRQEAEQRRRPPGASPTRTTPPPRAPRVPRGPQPHYVPVDLERERLAQANPASRNPRGGNYPPSPDYPYAPDMDPDYYGGAPMQQSRRSQDPSLPPPVPSGAFNPASQPDVQIWVHDDTVQPGKTYRYKVRYAIKNPLFRVPNITQDRKDAEQFAIWSDYSQFSSAIEIPDLINFFVSANMGGSPVVSFDVFRWQEGRQHKQSVRAGAGDIIGTVQDGIDFRTGWMVVDVRENPRGDTYVILMDSQGDLMSRDYRSDQRKDLYQQLQKEVEAARVAAVPGRR